MDKTAIKNFSIWARNKLIADITYKAGLLGITEESIKDALPQSTQDAEFYDIGTKEPYAIHGEEIKQRKELVSAIRKKASQLEYKDAYWNVIEEVAYTWFNRLIAIRFMEVNDYMPAHIRVLSSESGTKLEPDLVTTPFDAEIEFTQQETEHIMQMKNDNQVDALFRFLFIKQCNALNTYLPKLFEKTSDYTELLLNVSVTDQDGIVYHLIHGIEEDDFNINRGGQVEIIGWLYQYYISEKHDQIINIYKGTVKKEDIPAATQLFTTDWVVRYMVDNSLGRYWIERNPQSKLKEKLEFLVNLDYEPIKENIAPTDIKFFDPCMGSGHILVYAFDVLMDIYRECGYSDRDAAVSIIKNNIYGLDIDDRAYQLAYFAIMMKARSYNRRILQLQIEDNLCSFQESNGLSEFEYVGLTNNNEYIEIGQYLIDNFKNAKEIGSLMKLEKKDYVSFIDYLNSVEGKGQHNLFEDEWINNIKPACLNFAKQAMILTQKYQIVVTNPPYLNKFEGKLKDYVTTEYKAYSGDLFSVFIYRNFDFCIDKGYSAFMTPFVWMFIKLYENLREYIIKNKSICTLIQMEYSAFEEATVPICSFVLKNCKETETGIYIKLSDFKGGMEVQKLKVLDALHDESCTYMYKSNINSFRNIPGTPIAYWVSDSFISIFKNKLLYDYTISDGQNKTGNNAKYVRFFWEVSNRKIGKDKKWFFYAKGGGYRKWYGNLIDVVDWSPEARDFYRKDNVCRIIPEYLWYKKGITWGLITSSIPSFRILPEEATFDVGGSSVFVKDEKHYYYILGLLNSKVFLEVVKMMNPTLNYQVKDIRSMPVIIQREDEVTKIVKQIIDIAKEDWGNFETTWEFQEHPYITIKRQLGRQSVSISEISKIFEEKTSEKFQQLKELEQNLNQIFIEIYGLSNEISSKVEDKDVSIRKADVQRDIKSFLSYFVGCLFGRYSLDKKGIVYADGEIDRSCYVTFHPDYDNCVPITDEEYFADDIISKFAEFLSVAFGAEMVEVNLDFVASVLTNKGATSRDVIRDYFLHDFIKDHVKTYQKRPIYWMFDSGKKDGFKALIYLHGYSKDTIGNIRIDYLHRMEKTYESEIERMQDAVDNGKESREISKAIKRMEKLQKQLNECREYDEKISHLALSRIEINLDDGVKINYEKVQTASDGKKYQVLTRI